MTRAFYLFPVGLVALPAVSFAQAADVPATSLYEVAMTSASEITSTAIPAILAAGAAVVGVVVLVMGFRILRSFLRG